MNLFQEERKIRKVMHINETIQRGRTKNERTQMHRNEEKGMSN